MARPAGALPGETAGAIAIPGSGGVAPYYAYTLTRLPLQAPHWDGSTGLTFRQLVTSKIQITLAAGTVAKIKVIQGDNAQQAISFDSISGAKVASWEDVGTCSPFGGFFLNDDSDYTNLKYTIERVSLAMTTGAAQEALTISTEMHQALDQDESSPDYLSGDGELIGRTSTEKLHEDNMPASSYLAKYVLCLNNNVIAHKSTPYFSTPL
ncbi:MAG: hypothetical protein GY841_16630 [FCB group bacterium]|nr:hypothetical protein [FCB group bacterium]